MIDSIINMIKSALGREVRYGVEKGIRSGTSKLADTVKEKVTGKKEDEDYNTDEHTGHDDDCEEADATDENTEDEEIEADGTYDDDDDEDIQYEDDGDEELNSQVRNKKR